MFKLEIDEIPIEELMIPTPVNMFEEEKKIAEKEAEAKKKKDPKKKVEEEVVEEVPKETPEEIL
jgi:kynurenine formamidase